MKWRVIFLVAVLMAASWASVHASPPMPSFRYYGLLCNEYGQPVMLDDEVVMILMDGTNECSRYTVNEQLGDGINYILEAPIDYAKSTRYASYAARTGDVVTIHVYKDDVQQTLMSTSVVPTVGAAGDAVRLDMNLGTDADGDGMSDEWEELILNADGCPFSDITQVLPNDDFDGDHVSNLEEFRAGTAGEVPGDCFQVHDWMKSSDGTFAVYFPTVRGTTYAISTSPSSLREKKMEWSRSPFRTSVGGSEVMSYTAGKTDYYKYFYVLPQTNLNLIRLEIVK